VLDAGPVEEAQVLWREELELKNFDVWQDHFCRVLHSLAVLPVKALAVQRIISLLQGHIDELQVASLHELHVVLVNVRK